MSATFKAALGSPFLGQGDPVVDLYGRAQDMIDAMPATLQAKWARELLACEEGWYGPESAGRTAAEKNLMTLDCLEAWMDGAQADLAAHGVPAAASGVAVPAPGAPRWLLPAAIAGGIAIAILA